MFCGNWVRQSDSFNHIPWWHNCCTTGVTCMYLPKTTHFTYDRDLIASLQTSSGTIIFESCHGICHRWYAVSWLKAWGCTRSTCISVLQYACLFVRDVRGTVMKLSTRFPICAICMHNIAKWHPNCTLTSQEKLYILTCSLVKVRISFSRAVICLSVIVTTKMMTGCPFTSHWNPWDWICSKQIELQWLYVYMTLWDLGILQEVLLNWKYTLLFGG